MAQVLTESGNHVTSRRQSRGSNSTGEDSINDDTKEGYIVDSRGRIRGEARRFDPYARFGEIMLYEIDAFGFVAGYVSKNWQVMSEDDLLADSRMAKRLQAAKYHVWKRHNIIDLIAEYDRIFKDRNHFDRFCKIIYKDVLEKEKKIDF